MGNRKRKENIRISGTLKGDLVPYWQNTAMSTKDKWPPTQMEIYYIYCKMGKF